jgi:hypothetical protein
MKHTAGWRLAPGLALLACTAPGGPGSEPFVPTAIRDASAGEVSVSVAAACLPPSAEPLPGRIVETGDQGPSTITIERPVFVTDLFGRFKSFCGGCHVDGSLGNFHVDISSFADMDLAKVRTAIQSSDAAKFMPPPVALGKPWSERQKIAGDPVAALLNELEQWFAQKTPPDVFKVKSEQTAPGESFALPDDMARRQTNMGNCIPTRTLVATQAQEMDDLDARFLGYFESNDAKETLTELPDTLTETDLTTLDSAALARKGVVSFAPAYPLWSEDSGKMRAVRVPRGTSIKFDKATQKFSIPDNTRFYKTFLKKITQRDGQTVWRKIETRLIVARADGQNPDGTVGTKALFGTYAWNEEETEARLVRDPLRNGEPFADRLFTYVVDQPRYQEILDAKPGNLLFELAQPKNKGVVRRYMIPGKQRCVECHMGSPMGNFVLGFTPLQIRRRPHGEAGVYEESGPDELNQLQRLIDYGVITGISRASDVRGLEEPQGERKYRNKYELSAQAYLMGNCSHCHNPRGFPSVKSPDLVELLDFIPGEKGGIFQFPLDRTSPLRRRGASQNVEIPYITPSLRDFPVADPVTAAQGSTQGGLKGLWVPKWVDCLKGVWGIAFCDVFNQDDLRFISAPWRSLIYRNVDTPYIYADDYNVFPHMPRHSAGFDCRAPRMLGEWMVSIPAMHKKEGAGYEDNVRTGPFDTTFQPYEEVKPGDPAYLQALEGVSERLYEYRHGKRYGYCPDRTDIVVPEALTTTDPRKLTPPDEIQFTDSAKTLAIMPNDGVPDRAHVVPSDLTENPGEWSPRRGDFAAVIVNPKAPPPDAVVANVPWVLQGVRVTREIRDYATREIPFGVWLPKPECTYPGVKRARDYAGPDRAKWMSNVRAKLAPDDLIYSITPGGAVFSNICVNCHGPQADSKGLLAEAISEMTGGAARVANFKDGLLGPFDQVGRNIERVFGPIARMTSTPGLTTTSEDWAARYLSWMALGGTERVLPESLLKIVGATKVMGLPRKNAIAGSANMLSLAQGICATVLAPLNGTHFADYFASGNIDWSKTALLDTTGDAEMWIRLCSTGNRPVVRVPRYAAPDWVLDWRKSYFWGDDYGNNPVMNDRGQIDKNGIQAANWFPVCVAEQDLNTADPKDKPPRPMAPGGEPIPFCPPDLFEGKADEFGNVKATRALRVLDGSPPAFLGAEEWAVRGAAGAGMAVLLYLEEVRKGNLIPKPGYDHCEQLKK